MMRLALTSVFLFLINLCALGNWGLNGSDVRLTGLRERPWIIVVDVSTNLASNPACSFIVAFERDQPVVRLDVEDEKFNCLSYGLLHGEKIQKAMSRPQAITYGIEPLWKSRKATIYYFSVGTNFLERSKLVWGFGSRYKELGLGTATEDEWCSLSALAQLSRRRSKSDQAAISNSPIRYHSAQFGLLFSLPANWKGYTVLEEQWEAPSYPPDKDGPVVAARGPVIVFRHPQWKADDQYQDIPVLIFTRAQWKDEKDGKFFPYAGGVIGELWHNEKYVFALYSRYNAMDQIKGWKEASEILEQNAAANMVPHLYAE